MTSLATTIAVWAWVLVTAAGVDRAPDSPAGGHGPREMTLQARLRSCQEAARSDNWLALANCHHFPDAASRKACRQATAVDTKSALDRCMEQFSTR